MLLKEALTIEIKQLLNYLIFKTMDNLLKKLTLIAERLKERLRIEDTFFQKSFSLHYPFKEDKKEIIIHREKERFLLDIFNTEVGREVLDSLVEVVERRHHYEQRTEILIRLRKLKPQPLSNELVEDLYLHDSKLLNWDNVELQILHFPFITLNKQTSVIRNHTNVEHNPVIVDSLLGVIEYTMKAKKLQAVLTPEECEKQAIYSQTLKSLFL